MAGIRVHVAAVAEAPAANVEAVAILAHELFGVERVEPCFEEDVTEDHILDGSFECGRSGVA